MKKKTFFLSSKLWCLGAFALSLLAVSCAQDGFDDETFTLTVHDKQVESPKKEDITIRQNSFGTEQIISWPVVLGAGGFECKVIDESDAENPEVIFEQIVDGCTFRAKRDDDSNYRIYIRALGNKEYNNTDADMPTEIAYSTIVEPYKVIESGTDLADFFKSEQIPANEIDETTKEVVAIAYQLEAGGTYEMSDVVSFGNRKVLLYSTKVGADVKFTDEKAMFEIQNGLTLRNLRVDCAEATNIQGFIACSDTPEESVPFNEDKYTSAQKTGARLISEAVEIKNCMLKDLKKALIATSPKECNWVVVTINILNNIIQMDNEKDYFLNFYGGGDANKTSAFKELTIENNTIYNLKENSQYAIRFTNATNAINLLGPSQSPEAKRFEWKMRNNTIMRVFTGQHFGNNIPEKKCLTNILTDNIFIDCYNINKYVNVNQQNWTAYNNYFHAIVMNNGVPTSDLTFGSLADPGFAPPTTSLDLTQTNGGLNLTPSGVVFTAGAGDPRWLSE